MLKIVAGLGLMLVFSLLLNAQEASTPKMDQGFRTDNFAGGGDGNGIDILPKEIPPWLWSRIPDHDTWSWWAVTMGESDPSEYVHGIYYVTINNEPILIVDLGDSLYMGRKPFRIVT